MYAKIIKNTQVAVSVSTANPKNLKSGPNHKWVKIASTGSSSWRGDEGDEWVNMNTLSLYPENTHRTAEAFHMPLSGFWGESKSTELDREFGQMNPREMTETLIEKTSTHRKFDPYCEKMQSIYPEINVEMTAMDNFDLIVEGRKFHNVSSDQIETIMEDPDKFIEAARHINGDYNYDFQLWLVINTLRITQ